MTDNRPQDAIGLTLAEADPNLFEEIRKNLESGSLSDAAAHVTEEPSIVATLRNVVKSAERRNAVIGLVSFHESEDFRGIVPA